MISIVSFSSFPLAPDGFGSEDAAFSFLSYATSPFVNDGRHGSVHDHRIETTRPLLLYSNTVGFHLLMRVTPLIVMATLQAK